MLRPAPAPRREAPQSSAVFIISRAPAQHAASCAVAAASRRSSTRMGSTGKSRAICFAVFAFWRCARVRLNMVLLRFAAPIFPPFETGRTVEY